MVASERAGYWHGADRDGFFHSGYRHGGGEVNGEAIGFDAVGRGYFTLSDSSVTQPLRYFPRTSNDGPPTQRALVEAGASWQYLDKGTDQGTAWRTPLFDSSSWSNGVAQFGYGDGDEETVVSFGGMPRTNISRRIFGRILTSRMWPLLRI